MSTLYIVQELGFPHALLTEYVKSGLFSRKAKEKSCGSGKDCESTVDAMMKNLTIKGSKKYIKPIATIGINGYSKIVLHQ